MNETTQDRAEIFTHEDALQTHAVERYLLGELSGLDRDRFEAHLFDCTLCAADLNAGAAFVSAALPELEGKSENVLRFAAPVRRVQTRWQLWSLVAGLAACLAVIVYQSAVALPRLHEQLAAANMPAVLTPLVLANAGARGDANLPTVTPTRGSYLLAVDIPPSPAAAAFRCTLVSTSGATLWHVDIRPAQARDAVTLQVPAQTAAAGIYELRIQAVPPSQNGDTLVLLATYRYRLSLATTY